MKNKMSRKLIQIFCVVQMSQIIQFGRCRHFINRNNFINLKVENSLKILFQLKMNDMGKILLIIVAARSDPGQLQAVEQALA